MLHSFSFAPSWSLLGMRGKKSWKEELRWETSNKDGKEEGKKQKETLDKRGQMRAVGEVQNPALNLKV